jgi:ArsR family transcriptional regulator
MQSLADETRLRLLHLLERHELGVAELCEIVQLPQSTVSRHLKILSDDGWTQSRRQGTTHLYRLVLDELDPDARKLWLLTRDQTQSWSAVAHDEMRLERVLRQRQSESQSFFAGAAAEWDRLRVEMYGQGFIQTMLPSLIPDSFTVADLGCGTGQMAELLSPHIRQVIAVDNSAAMLKAARKRLAGRENVQLHRAPIETLPIETGSCDAAMLVLVLAYVDEPLAALKEAARILKPGGKLVIIDLLQHDRDDFRRMMNQRWPGFDRDWLRGRLIDAGFDTAAIEIVPLPTEPQARGPAMFLATARRGQGAIHEMPPARSEPWPH